ncbi:hypothetical protein PHLCEN_2v5276 [Hermanssonia centrifuga]|uniref:Uncharacterized protein n=1 Tax=Hermanssonia centrifuga TaxID=98765 RepID=A0A2R6P8L3_9APHY|nr:hypothetical protein PHLCEN_2v5276 [Hermanssonia centrifuga]
MSEHLQTQRYFAKQQELMNLADESREDFLARISARRRRVYAPLHIMPSTDGGPGLP